MNIKKILFQKMGKVKEELINNRDFDNMQIQEIKGMEYEQEYLEWLKKNKKKK